MDLVGMSLRGAVIGCRCGKVYSAFRSLSNHIWWLIGVLPPHRSRNKRTTRDVKVPSGDGAGLGDPEKPC